jgi:hypothetical protein
MDAKDLHNWHDYHHNSPRFYIFTGDNVPCLLCFVIKNQCVFIGSHSGFAEDSIWDVNVVSLGEEYPTFRMTVVASSLESSSPRTATASSQSHVTAVGRSAMESRCRWSSQAEIRLVKVIGIVP